MRRALVLGFLLTTGIAGSLNGCGGDDEPPVGNAGSGGSAGMAGDATDDAPSLGNASLGDPSGFSLAVSSESGLSVELRRAAEVLLEFDLTSFVLGRVSALDDSANYDPYPLLTGAPGVSEPEGLEWLAVVSARIVAADAMSVRLELAHEQDEVSDLTAKLDADGRFSLGFQPRGDRVAYLRLVPRVDASEAFYGLGEYFDDVNQRGKVRAMQLELNGALESSNNEAHVPVPFVTGTRGWGLFVENPYPASFDMAKTDPERAEVTFGTGLASSAGISVHLFAADRPLDVFKHYYEVTGYPRLPARWALGPLVWRDENDDQAQVENDADTIRALDLATSGIWIDRPYASGVNTFDFDAGKFPNPQAMIDKLHDLGFRVALWHTPYLDDKDAATAALRMEAESKGYYPPQTGLLLNGWGKPIDLTNAAAYDFWQAQIAKYTDMGIEGFKLDYGEDIVPGLFGARNVWRFSDGSDERSMHSQFQPLYHRVYAEKLPASGGFLLCRGGTYGDQVNVSVIWPGDLDASFAKHGERVSAPGGDYTAVGGLPASVIAGLSLGASGFPFFGADTGGYRHSPPDKETFRRWFEQTALSSVMQIGTSSNDVAWEFNDQALLDSYREYTRLHLRLFPYEWTYAERIKTTGHPIQRALGLSYPELGQHPNDEYLFGEELLVAPVVEAQQVARDVIFPPGKWVNYWSGELVDGQSYLAELEDAA